jgi:hypothetical protein
MILSKSDTVLGSKFSQDSLDGLSQRLTTGVSCGIQPFIFYFTPQTLNFIQLRTVSRQKKNRQACLLPPLKTSLESLRAMHGCIVHYQNCRSAPTNYPLIDAANHKLTSYTNWAGKTHQMASLIDPSQSIDSAAGLTRPLQGMACRFPTLGNNGYQTETRFMAIKQINMALNWQGLQVDQAVEFVPIVSWSQQLYTPSDALPAPATLFKKRWSVLWLNSRLSSWRKTCRAAFNCWAWALTCWLTKAASAEVRMGLRPWPG